MGSCGNGSRVEMENGWSFLSSDPLTVTENCWAVAEEATEEVVNCLHPTLDTEEKRKDVIDYVQSLIKFSLGCEVNLECLDYLYNLNVLQLILSDIS